MRGKTNLHPTMIEHLEQRHFHQHLDLHRDWPKHTEEGSCLKFIEYV